MCLLCCGVLVVFSFFPFSRVVSGWVFSSCFVGVLKLFFTFVGSLELFLVFGFLMVVFFLGGGLLNCVWSSRFSAFKGQEI